MNQTQITSFLRHACTSVFPVAKPYHNSPKNMGVFSTEGKVKKWEASSSNEHTLHKLTPFHDPFLVGIVYVGCKEAKKKELKKNDGVSSYLILRLQLCFRIYQSLLAPCQLLIVNQPDFEWTDSKIQARLLKYCTLMLWLGKLMSHSQYCLYKADSRGSISLGNHHSKYTGFIFECFNGGHFIRAGWGNCSGTLCRAEIYCFPERPCTRKENI